MLAKLKAFALGTLGLAAKAVRALVAWLGPVFNTIRGKVNILELARVFMLALTMGGGTIGALEAIKADASAIILDPKLMGGFVFVMTALIDFDRRYNHGALPSPEPPK